MPSEPYYRDALAYVHDQGFAGHADACAPAILAQLQPVRQRNGLVLEIGCGSGHLTRHLVAAGHRVIATDASPAMVALTRERVQGVDDVAVLTLPDDPVPSTDAIVSVGHVLSYLPSANAINQAIVQLADALRAGGVLAFDIVDLSWNDERGASSSGGRMGDDWAIVAEYSAPAPDRFVRQMAAFTRNDDGTWTRDDERHENVLVDTSRIPRLLAEHDVEADVSPSFGAHELPHGLVAITGRKRG